MFLKKKNIPVIIFSVAIIASVLLSSLFFLHIYFVWKENRSVSRYENLIYEKTASMFSKNIIISNIRLVPGRADYFAGKPLVEGSIKNNTDKTVSSVLIEISLVRMDGVVVYRHRFHSFGTGPGSRDFSSPLLYPLISPTDNMLLPGDGVSFKHILSNCDNTLINRVQTKTNFASNRNKRDLKFSYSIIGLSVV